MIEKVAGRRYARDDARYFEYYASLSFSLNMLIDKFSFLFVFFRLPVEVLMRHTVYPAPRGSLCR